MTTVTIDVPAFPAPIPELPGDAGSMRAFAADLLATSSALDDLASFAANVRTDDYWYGAAAEAYGAAASDSADDADSKSLVLRKVSGQVEDFADEMDAFEVRRLGLYDRRTTLSSRRIDLITDINATKDATDAQIEVLKERSRHLRTSLTVLYEDHATLLEDVKTSGQQMIAAFQAADTQAEVRETGDTLTDPADAAMTLPGAPGDDSSPADVNTWWTSLSPTQQRAVIAARPEVIGNTNGIPTDVRDEANRISLDLDLDALETREDNGENLSFAEEQHLERARAAQEALENVANRTDPVTDEPVPGYLTLYDPTAFGGDGAVAVSVGNPDTADNVSVSVPGMMNDGATIVNGTDSVFNLYSTARASDPDASVASTMWIGYDGPSNFGLHGLDSIQVIDEGLADAGGEQLAAYLDGVRATRQEGLDPAHLTAIGHSYGSTTVGNAATDHGIPVDDIVLIGSPGAGHEADHASDLGIDEDHVWTGANSRDPVSGLARNGWVGTGLGLDPADEDFGAHRFQAEDVDRETGEGAFYNHNQYYQSNSESLFNMGQIVAGNDDQVLGADQRYDPWYRTMVDPEHDRTPTDVSTGYDR